MLEGAPASETEAAQGDSRILGRRPHSNAMHEGIEASGPLYDMRISKDRVAIRKAGDEHRHLRRDFLIERPMLRGAARAGLDGEADRRERSLGSGVEASC